MGKPLVQRAADGWRFRPDVPHALRPAIIHIYGEAGSYVAALPALSKFEARFMGGVGRLDEGYQGPPPA